MARIFSRSESGWLYLVVFGCLLFFFALGLFVGRGYGPEPEIAAVADVASAESSVPFASDIGATRKGRGSESGLDEEESSHESQPSTVNVLDLDKEREQKAPELIVDRPASSPNRSEPRSPQEEEVLPAGKKWVYTVQVGAFRTHQEANQVAVRLSAKGYEPTLVGPDSDNSFHRICVGQAANRADLSGLVNRLKSDGFPTYVRQLNAELLAR